MMQECASEAFDRLREHQVYVPQSFVAFYRDSPHLMMPWLQSVASYSKNRALLENAEKELEGQALSSKKSRGRGDKHLSYSLAHRIVKWNRNRKDSKEDLTSVTSAVIGSSKAARSEQALAALAESVNRLSASVERARLEAAFAYSRIVVAVRSESTTIDRAFFSAFFQLSNFVLEAFVPEEAMPRARNELRRLVTHRDFCQITTTGDNSRSHVWQRLADAANIPDDGSDDDELRKETKSRQDDEDALSTTAGEMNDASLLKRKELGKIAVKNIHVSKQFLEAAALRLLLRRHTKERAKKNDIVGEMRTSPLVARYLNAMKDPDSEKFLRETLAVSSGTDADGRDHILPSSSSSASKKQDQRRLSSEVVPQQYSRYVRKRPSQVSRDGDSENANACSTKQPLVPVRPTNKTPAKQLGTAARLTAARNSLSLLDQQLTILMNQSCDYSPPCPSGSPPSRNTRRRSRTRRNS